jgi:hypothetical protein
MPADALQREKEREKRTPNSGAFFFLKEVGDASVRRRPSFSERHLDSWGKQCEGEGSQDCSEEGSCA